MVGSWLFCLQNFPCLVSFWCMRGGSVEVWTKNILYRFMEGQTHFGMPRGVKMSLALHEPIYGAKNSCEWTNLRKACNTCRRGPRLCPCSPRIPHSMLVKRTPCVNKPLICYQYQQDFTPSSKVGYIHQLYNHRYKQFIILTDKKKQTPWVNIRRFKFMANLLV